MTTIKNRWGETIDEMTGELARPEVSIPDHWTPEAAAQYMRDMSGLPTDLLAKMDAAKAKTSEPCPVCRVGRGKFCIDVAGTVTIDGIHPQRTAWTEADDLTRASFRR